MFPCVRIAILVSSSSGTPYVEYLETNDVKSKMTNILQGKFKFESPLFIELHKEKLQHAKLLETSLIFLLTWYMLCLM